MAPGQHYYMLFFWRSLRSHAPSLANAIFVGRKKQKQRQKKCSWIGCNLTPVKRLWQQTLVGMAKKAKVARCSIVAARTLAFLCFTEMLPIG